MKKTLPALVLLPFLLFSLISCNKGTPETDVIAGTWYLSQVAIDQNGNNQIDSGELLTPGTVGLMQSFTFNPDGTGVATIGVPLTGIDSSFQIKWQLLFKTQDMVLTLPGLPEQTMHIVTLSGNAMTLDGGNTLGLKSWLLFNKQ